MVYIVTYDLNKSGQNYNELYEAIKDYGTYLHVAESTWLIETSEYPASISEYLRKNGKLDDNDLILVIRVTDSPKYSGWLKQSSWDWLNGRTY